MAVIALDVSSTWRCPNPKRLALAHARTLGSPAVDVARAQAGRSVVPSRDPRAPPEASLRALVHAITPRGTSAGSNREKTRRKVSCPGMPCGQSSRSAHHAAWDFPDSARASPPTAHGTPGHEEAIPQAMTPLRGIGAARISQRGQVVLKRGGEEQTPEASSW